MLIAPNFIRMAFIVFSFSAGVVLADGVTIALHQEQSEVPSDTVRVGDIAEMHGGTSWDRKNISDLDLESLKKQSDCMITKKQVELRLMLAGYKRDRFRVTGPPVVHARLRAPVQLRVELEKMLREELSRQFAIDLDRISIHVTNSPHIETIQQTLSTSLASVELVPLNEFPLGRTRLRTDLIDRRGVRLSQTLDVQISLAMKVAIASAPIPRGTTIEPHMIRLVDRAVTQRANYVTFEGAVGKSTSRYIPSDSILLSSHLVATRSRGGALVRRNDLIDVVVKVGNGEIRLKNARAVGSGSVGDTIEILNPNSGRSLNARIVGPNLATVSSHPRRMQ